VTGTPITALGYPDMGEGLYSEKLEYKDWFEFNNAQRAHLNFVENLFLVIPCLLISGLELPNQAANAGFVFFIGRLLYGYGYRLSGPKGRMVGAIFGMLGLFSLIVMTGLTAYWRYHNGNGLLYFSVLSVILACFFCGIRVSKGRSKVFSEEWLTKHFGKQHEEATGKKIGRGGYPDMGNGIYGQLLSYENWHNFNCIQRGHLNFIEFIGGTTPLLLVAGAVNYSFYTAILGFTFAFGRVLYALGYSMKGAKGRLLGAGLSELPLIVVLGFACHNAFLLVKPAFAHLF